MFGVRTLQQVEDERAFIAFGNGRSGVSLASGSRDWYEAYLEHLEAIVGPLQPAGAAE